MCRLPSRHVFVFFLLSEKSFDSSIVKNITRLTREVGKSSKKIWFIWDSLKRNSLTKMNGLLCPGNETITLIKDICNPCGTDDGLTHCSIGCIDANYTQRKWLSNHKLTKLTISIPLFLLVHFVTIFNAPCDFYSRIGDTIIVFLLTLRHFYYPLTIVCRQHNVISPWKSDLYRLIYFIDYKLSSSGSKSHNLP